jgi:hypothetical protein
LLLHPLLGSLKKLNLRSRKLDRHQVHRPLRLNLWKNVVPAKMKLITMVEVVIMEAVGMVTNLHTVEVMETPNPITTVDTDKDIRLNMVENNIPHTVEVMETTNPHPNTTHHPHHNTAVGTDKDTRFNMVEGPDIQLNLTEEDMGPDIQLNLTEEVIKLPPMEDIPPQVTEATNKEAMEVCIQR